MEQTIECNTRNTLQHMLCVAVCCSVLQCVAVTHERRVLEKAEMKSECDTLQHAATRCNTLQHTATDCNRLQHTATLCNTSLVLQANTQLNR